MQALSEARHADNFRLRARRISSCFEFEFVKVIYASVYTLYIFFPAPLLFESEISR
jgi:hypothetical protein